MTAHPDGLADARLEGLRSATTRDAQIEGGTRIRWTGAADLKSLTHLRQKPFRDVRSKAALESWICQVPFAFRSSYKRVAALSHELRKADGWLLHCISSSFSKMNILPLALSLSLLCSMVACGPHRFPDPARGSSQLNNEEAIDDTYNCDWCGVGP